MLCAEDYVRFCCKHLLESCMPDLQFITKMIDAGALPLDCANWWHAGSGVASGYAMEALLCRSSACNVPLVGTDGHSPHLR